MEHGPYKCSLDMTGENQCKVHGVAVNHLGLRSTGRFDSCLAHERRRSVMESTPAL